MKTYPNPFNPETKLTYSLPSTGEISLNVYNINGKLVDTLIKGQQSSGSHEITFNASNLPSGVYFARLEWGGGIVTEKLLLLK